jgi:hypothetical protein
VRATRAALEYLVEEGRAIAAGEDRYSRADAGGSSNAPVS